MSNRAQTRDPKGSPPGITEEDLPPSDTRRWVTRRKATVVTAVRIGLITLEEACRRYALSVEEFMSWQRLVETHGVEALRTTRIRDYRMQAEGDD